MSFKVEFEQGAGGLWIPAVPKYAQSNQIAAWRRYFNDRAAVFARAKAKHWKPEDNRVYAAMDIETYDPEIANFGPGSVRNLGHILGVGIYCPQLGYDDYFEYTDARVKNLIEDPNVTLIFHNAVYDLDWLCCWDKTMYKCKARIEDTMTRQALIDTYSPSLSLDYCCKMFGIEGKNKGDTIEDWWERNTGKPRSQAIKNLINIPREVVGRYCRQDCKAPYELFMAQQPVLEEEDLLRANDIECRLYPWLLQTRKNGIRIDNVARQQLSDDVTRECEQYEADFRQKYGDVNINSNKQLQGLWAELGLPFEYSKTGSISFGYDQMLEFKNGGDQLNMTDAQKEIAHQVATDILQIREYRKLLDTFVDGQFVDMQYNGRLYTCLYPSKRDVSGGTVTGRFSCLAVGTPVWTEEYGYIPIEQCAKGMHIMTHKGTIRPIKQVRFTGYKEVGYTAGLLSTADHRIWNGKAFRRADCTEEVTYYDECWLNYKSRMERKGDSNVPSRRQTYDKGNSFQIRLLSQTREEVLGYVLTSRCIRSGESSQVLEVLGEEARSRKSDVQSQRSRAPKLQRRVQGRNWSYDDDKRWEEMADASLSYGGYDRSRCREFTKESSSTSYRRRRGKQQPRQSVSLYARGAQALTRKITTTGRWQPVGVVPVFDIEVDGEEHSFIAAGIPVHNSANPNLQQVPAHSKWGKQTRSIFVPEEGMLLGAFDYKQVEYRLFTHFAQGEEGRAAQRLYAENPDLDYHEMGQRMMGWWYPDDEWANKEARHMMKRLSFGNLYGLKAKTFSEHFKWDLLKSHPNVKQSELLQLAKDLQGEYQTKVPFIKVTNDAIMKTGQRRGYVKTLSGKRQRMPPLPSKGSDDAYKLINHLVQGSAGDVFKKGVCVDAYEAGVFDVLISHLMVHDELVFSIPQTKIGYEACMELKEKMSEPYDLKVALGVDTEIGEDWGHCNEENWKEFEEEYSDS